jgi:hypothetical protein
MPNDKPNHNGVLRVVTPPKSRANGQVRTLGQLAASLRQIHAQGIGWREAALACRVLTKSGQGDPGLAFRIAVNGYDPRRPETRQRLGLPPVCIECGQKIKIVRVVPEWLNQATNHLQRLQETTGNAGIRRIYAKGGRRVE